MPPYNHIYRVILPYIVYFINQSTIFDYIVFLEPILKKCECRSFLSDIHTFISFMIFRLLIHMVHNQRIVFLNHGIARRNDGFIAPLNHDYLFRGRKI